MVRKTMVVPCNVNCPRHCNIISITAAAASAGRSMVLRRPHTAGKATQWIGIIDCNPSISASRLPCLCLVRFGPPSDHGLRIIVLVAAIQIHAIPNKIENSPQTRLRQELSCTVPTRHKDRSVDVVEFCDSGMDITPQVHPGSVDSFDTFSVHCKKTTRRVYGITFHPRSSENGLRKGPPIEL